MASVVFHFDYYQVIIRHHRTKVENKFSFHKIINIGLPQGSILSPLLFLLYVNDISYVSENCNKILFADNLTFNNLFYTCNLKLEKFGLYQIDCR